MFTALDWIAVGVLIFGWQAIGWTVEKAPFGRPSTYQLMLGYRQEWMKMMVRRDPRIFDAQVLAALQQTGAFFSSACLLALGGGIALLGQADRASQILADISATLESPVVVWEIKLLLVLALLAIALLRFIWSVRLYGYQAIVMSAVPNEVSEAADATARRAGSLNIFAARSFNRGLRALYVSITALAWLIGPIPLLITTGLTFVVILRREFFSMSRTALL